MLWRKAIQKFELFSIHPTHVAYRLHTHLIVSPKLCARKNDQNLDKIVLFVCLQTSFNYMLDIGAAREL